MPTAPGADVLEAFRRGEDAAFFAVYEAHAGEVRALAARYFRSPFDREEAVQEIWLNVHRSVDKYDPALGPLGPWLHTVATNRCLQILRARSRRPQAAGAPREEELPATGAAPDEAAREVRLRAAVQDFVARLARRSREEADVFAATFVEGLGNEDAAARLGISVRRCKYLKVKALAEAEQDPGLRGVLEELLP